MLSVDVRELLLKKRDLETIREVIILIAEEVERLGEQKQNEFDN